MLAQPPLGLYIHVPWCVRKCPYCDFNSHEASGEIPQTEYVDKLLRDFDHDYALSGDRTIESIFIGGGTPSLFSAESYDRIFEHLASHSKLSAKAEITLEANPGTVEADKFKDYRRTGINRLSIGVQSFNNKHLQVLGRIHNGDKARRAIDLARAAGFTNFNLDLMHGLPEQSESDALLDLATAIEFNPQHVSWYQLTIEPNTVFYSKPPKLPADDLLGEIQLAGEDFLAGNGYQHYEVSAFCKPSAESQHNLNYWQFGDYIGIGAGAHGKLTFTDSGIIRLRKHKQPKHYLTESLSFVAERIEVGVEERALEYLMNCLRLRAGFSISEFEAYTGTSFANIQDPIDSLLHAKLIYTENGMIKTTNKGWRYLNSVLEEFL